VPPEHRRLRNIRSPMNTTISPEPSPNQGQSFAGRIYCDAKSVSRPRMKSRDA